MIIEIERLRKEVEGLDSAPAEGVDSFKVGFLGRKGKMKEFYAGLKNVPNDQKREVGQAINALKLLIESKVSAWSQQGHQYKSELEDLTRPGRSPQTGSLHPISLVKNEVVAIFKRIGFILSEGPEIEDDWHNFSALNFPPQHPARDMQDTFFVDKDNALRTHTSSVQVRVMESGAPPIRTISPGRVFRNEAISARSHCIFHQIEGLYIDKGVSFADLKQTLLFFAKELLGEKTDIRLRPSYFPFTEPSAEVDVYWGLETETDYRITKGTGWLEILGCGMVDPNVLTNCDIDPEVYSGFAFGMGIERLAMLKYQIPDIRMFFENDQRFLSRFK
ncbi:MAG: phenylalanine--tRNA ligase subunit alpha [Flavobacteriales bacterium]|nr:phenylalanine--tRNA ligase subunit alpha [Flavobacteriales bacterium]